MTKYIPSCVHHATVCSPHTLVLLTVSKFALHFGGKDCHRLSSDKKEQLDRVHEVKKKKKNLDPKLLFLPLTFFYTISNKND